MGLLVILFDRELRCEVFQQIAMGTPHMEKQVSNQ
jgi:hypothetical protein